MCEDTRSATLDAGNVKLTYNALLEKVERVATLKVLPSMRSAFLIFSSLQAESREKERQREEARKQKKLDQAFLLCLQELLVDHKLEWEEVREKIQEEAAFKAITLESERVRLYKVQTTPFGRCWPKEVLKLFYLFLFFFAGISAPDGGGMSARSPLSEIEEE